MIFKDTLLGLFERLFGRRDREQVEEYMAEPLRYRCAGCDAPYGTPHEPGCIRARPLGEPIVVSEDVEDKTPLADQYAGEFPLEEGGLWAAPAEKLAYRERQVLQWLYGAKPETYGEVAQRFDITPQRVKMVEDQAIKRLLSLTGDREHDPVLGPEQGGDRQTHGISQLPSQDHDRPRGPAESSE